MSTIRRVFLSFTSPEKVPRSREEMEGLVGDIKVPACKVILVLCGLDEIEPNAWLLPLVDSWLAKFPGRVFLEKVLSVGSPLAERVPLYSKISVWQGLLHLSETESVSIALQEPLRYDRIPSGEDLYVLGSLFLDQIELIPLSGSSGCVIGANELLLNNLVLISVPSSQWTECKLFLLQDSGSIRSIQSPSTFLSLYQTEVSAGREETYLRSLAMGPRTVSQALLTKKQMNILNTVALMESRVLNFFIDNKMEVDGSVDGLSVKTVSNFENTLVQKQIDKLEDKTQENIEEILKQNSCTSFEDMMYKGKRQRRVIGTMWNSHQWPHAPVIKSTDGLLLSEVVGSVFP